MPVAPDTKIIAPTDAEQARTGWKMQRHAAMRDRAEAAQRAEAVAAGRVIRGGTYRVTLPPEYSVSPDGPGAADAEFVTLPHSGQLAEVVEVTLPLSVITDPRNVWGAMRLVTVVNGAARNMARRIRGASQDDAQDAASRVIEDIMARTRGGMPLRTDVTPAAISGAVRHKLADIIAERERETPDGENYTDAASAADAEDHAEMQRALRDADPMLDLSISPWAPEIEHALEHVGLSQAERDAIVIDGVGVRAAEVARHTGRAPSTVRVSVRDGRRKLAARTDLEHVASVIDTIARTLTTDERRQRAGDILRRLITGTPEHARPIKPWPDRMPTRHPEDEADAHTVAHAPVTFRTISPDEVEASMQRVADRTRTRARASQPAR